MAKLARKPVVEVEAVVEALPVMEVEYIAPATYMEAVARHEKRIELGADSRMLTGFTKPCAARDGTITHAVWVALQAPGLSYTSAIAAALHAECAAHRARGKAPKGTGLSAAGWLRTFGATFAQGV